MSRTAVGALAADLSARVFAAPASASLTPRRVGAEVELIPVDAASGRRCPIDGSAFPGQAPATLPFLRRYGARAGWRETRTAKDTPSFELPGGTLTFEPGGQLEYSSLPCRSASALLALLRSMVTPLLAAAAGEGIELLTVGLDPANPVERAPLLLCNKRYARMAEYLASRSPHGARMMRQTAAFQMSLDLDDEPWLRWRVLNAAAPYLTAIFANSPVYHGQATGYQSTRAAIWRALDPGRTGLPWDARDPVAGYLAFALDAPAMLLPTLGGEYRSFGEWLRHAEPTYEEWVEHLSTLFPEVRPRRHYEVRSCDALAPRWYAAPLALVVGMTYDPGALRIAADLLGPPDVGVLERAGRLGLRDPAIARTATDLTDIALRGCAGLGPGYFHPADLEQAAAFFDQYTRRSRSPADDVLNAEIAA
jgi:glutamate--cysteine ligase